MAHWMRYEHNGVTGFGTIEGEGGNAAVLFDQYRVAHVGSSVWGVECLGLLLGAAHLPEQKTIDIGRLRVALGGGAADAMPGLHVET